MAGLVAPRAPAAAEVRGVLTGDRRATPHSKLRGGAGALRDGLACLARPCRPLRLPGGRRSGSTRVSAVAFPGGLCPSPRRRVDYASPCVASASVSSGATPVAGGARRPDWHLAALAMAVSMHFGNMQRAIMSIVSIPLQEELALTMTDMGVLQSAFLWGYLACQFPSGVLADKYGGVRVLLICLALWSLASVCTPLARRTAFPVAFLCAARAVAGAAQAAVVPAAGSAAAALVPEGRRGSVLSGSFAAFNMGTVASLVVTPLIVGNFGWTGAFYVLGGVGLASAVAMYRTLPAAVLAPGQQGASYREPEGAPGSGAAGGGGWGGLTRRKWLDVAVLAWAHGVIGWSFFILQSWVPTFMHQELGAQSLRGVGLLSAVPWVAMAVVTVAGGRWADALVRRGGGRAAIASRMQAIGTIGPALGVACLLMVGSWQSAVAALTFALGTSGFTYPGFHAYVQIACGRQAGALLGITNSVGIVLGIVGNVVTGKIVQQTGSFTGVWVVMVVLYLSSWLAWTVVLRGDVVFE